MAKKLVTMDAPTDYTPDIESTGFSTENITRTLDGTPASETAAFEATQAAVQTAQYRIGVLAADIERHLLTLREGIVIRTGEMQATLSLEDIETITDDLIKARDALVAVLAKSGEAEVQSNDEKAKLVMEILDKMEADGEFDGLSEDDTAGERQLLGMRLRAEIEPEAVETGGSGAIKLTGKHMLHSSGANWFHFRIDPRSALESFSVTYCHDGSVCMTGDMGCLVWQREYFPKKPDYGFPYTGTGIGYFAEKIVRAEESQVIKSWNQDAAIADIKEAIREDRDKKDREVLSNVYNLLSGFESGEYGYFQMLEAFNVPHNIEGEELCEFGRDYSEPFKMRFGLLQSVSDQIIASVSEAAD